MRKIMVSGWELDENDEAIEVERGEAIFHCFSMNSGIDPSIFAEPVAIVEWPDGKVETIYAEMIRFLDRK